MISTAALELEKRAKDEALVSVTTRLPLSIVALVDELAVLHRSSRMSVLRDAVLEYLASKSQPQ